MTATRPSGKAIPWKTIEALTFDCYGTLIDWESGLLASLTPVISRGGEKVSAADILQLYATFEGEEERDPFRNYKEVLRSVMDRFGSHLHCTFNETDRDCLVGSIKTWRPFPDTVNSLRRLKKRFTLGIISNTDDDIFSVTQPHLGVTFDWIVTAEQVRSYKPSLNNFRRAIDRMGVPMEKIVHVAQSLYHDVAPANKLGLHSVWIDRRKGQVGPGATPAGAAQPDLIFPDLESLAVSVGV
jgi:2-haloacid dehalogenase